MIFFYSYMLLWFYVYSSNFFAFYNFLQPKCNRKISFYYANYYVIYYDIMQVLFYDIMTESIRSNMFNLAFVH